LPELEKVFNASDRKPEQEPMITFHYDVAKDAKAKFANHEVYWLHAWAKDKKTGKYPNIEDLIKQAKDANLDGLDLHSGFPIDKEFVKKVHDAGLKLYTWTVDDPEVARQEMEAGVDGITTNRPGWMREQLGKSGR
jgi:glycerophosphoryl diester phosphodiesterase